MKYKDFKKAADAFGRALEVKPQDKKLAVSLGVMLMNLERYEEAIEILHKGTEDNLEGGNAWLYIGNSHLTLGNTDAAVHAYRKNLEVLPNNWGVHFELGCVLREQGKYVEALQSFRRTVELKPNHAKAWVYIGATLIDQQLYDDAIGPLESVLSVQSENPEAWYYRGLVYAAKGEKKEAKDAFKQAKKKAKEIKGLQDKVKAAMKDL